MKPNTQHSDVQQDVKQARLEMGRRLLLTLLTFYATATLLLFALAVYLGEEKTIVLTAINLALAVIAYMLQKRDRLRIAGAFVSF